MGDFIALHRRAMQLGIPCLTSLDTAGALADILASRFTESNTELVDINHLRTARQRVPFLKMQGCGDDAAFIENFDGAITCPESLCVQMCTEHFGVGGYGIVLLENSPVADAKMRSFNRDGSEGKMAANNLRCAAKYLYDSGRVPRTTMTVETASGVKTLQLYLRDGRVGAVRIAMGAAVFDTAALPAATSLPQLVDSPVTIGGSQYRITALSVGNPHCVVFCEGIDTLNLEEIGPAFEYAPLFPGRINTEFVRVVSRTTLRMRVWERGNGETQACGTGACAAVAAAVKNGLCDAGQDVTVKVRGGDLVVNYTDENVLLTGDAKLVYEGVFEF